MQPALPAFLPAAPPRLSQRPSLRPSLQPLSRRPACHRRAVCRRAPARITACAPTPNEQQEQQQQEQQQQSPDSDNSSGSGGSGGESVAGDVTATLAWVGVAAATAAAVARWRGGGAGVEFVTAYILEYSLSVDNLFVFLLIFDYFQVPRASQSRVLAYGIGGAVAMRGAMIVAGAELVRRFKWVTVAFAAVLLYSAAKLLVEGDGDGDEDLAQSPIVRFARAVLPLSDAYDGDRFFTSGGGEGGKWLATPLMLVLVCIELSDVVFALDSVPAVLGISTDSVVIYASNILAVAGLRNLFFLLSDSIGGLRFLPQALAVVLGFVGAKMIAGVGGFEVGVVQSLAVVVGTLGGGVALSVALPEEGGEGGGGDGDNGGSAAG